jgi:hypothetical protein
MFRIASIKLDDQEEIKLNSDFVFIYGENNVGKTLLAKTIEFMLGSSSIDLWELQGLKNISSVECIVEIGDKDWLFLKRDRNNSLFYKYNSSDEYIQVDLNSYKSKIQNSFAQFDEELYRSYYHIVGEKLTFRGVSYYNFIDQNSLGKTQNIIPESNEIQFYKRIIAQTLFFFDKETQEEINRQRDVLTEIESRLKELRNNENKRQFALNGIEKEFRYLSLPFSYDLECLKKTLSEYKKGVRQKTNIHGEKELAYLYSASAKLSSQIAIEQRLEKQSALVTERNNRIKTILEFLKTIIGTNESYSDYFKSIESSLEEINTREMILSAKDYKKTISNLEDEKRSLDFRIEIIRNDLSEKSYLDISKSLNSLEGYLGTLDSIKDSTLEFDKLEEQRKHVVQRLDELNKKKRVLSDDSLNATITKEYLSMPKDINFVLEDIKRDISIVYNPTTQSLNGKENEKGLYFIPGSKARQSCWQIIAIICLHHYIQSKFQGFPLLPFLLIDGINEPFDDSKCKFDEICDYIGNLCLKNHIQLIVTSAKKPNNIHNCLYLDITSGYNKRYTKDNQQNHV